MQHKKRGMMRKKLLPTKQQLVPCADVPVKQEKPRRLTLEQKADLIEFARGAIQDAWNDVGETTAEVLADNVVSAQEFAWLSMHFPVAVPVEPMGGYRVDMLDALIDRYFCAEKNTFGLSASTIDWIRAQPEYQQRYPLVPVEDLALGAHDVRAERFESGVVYVSCNVCGSGAGYYESWTQ